MNAQSPPRTAVLPPPAARTALSVFLRGLTVDAHIGVHAYERGRTQPLVVDVELELDVGPVERLSDTVDYERLAAHARAVADAGHVDLVEEYAERLARACLADPRVSAVRVRCEKPEAIPGAAGAGCEVRVARA